MRSPSEVHLRLEHVTKRFGETTAVNDVSFEVPRGSFATLLGPSGCGKTTTLRMIAGFYDPDHGDIVLGGKRINELPAHRRGTAMVFQDYALFPHMTVKENVAYGLRVAGVPGADRERRVHDILQFVGLGGLGDRWPNQLSGGQQQRVAVGRALVLEPQILLLDEPLSNLDAKLRVQLRWELRALQQRLGMTFVYVTHDQDEALSLSDWIAVMNAGKVEQAGTPWEIYYHPRTSFLADFVGAVNLVPGTVQKLTGDEAVIAFGSRAIAVRVPSGLALAVGREVRLCVRPEALALRPPSADPDGVRLPGVVARRAFLGDLMRYWVTVDGREWIVDQPDPGAAADFDGPVTVAVKPERIHVIAE
ncbi:MAG: ABC transporter ATP-binding protein [Chloroflexi bacterium]|nr:MAG: ABC transporter ATP-binding protein [Chloroflexota bacterium]TME86271.1 MAG: ABC transporter ATP-binding protein [Chloroflexota bacterium]